MRKKSFTPLDKSKNTRKNYLTGFTLLELIIVIIIIGILSTLALTQYGGYREGVLNQEARANLRLIFFAERVWYMESNNNQYVACATTQLINTNLRLTIPTTNPAWNYEVRTYGTPAGPDTRFCAQATRTRLPVRWWCLWESGLADPQPIPNNICP